MGWAIGFVEGRDVGYGVPSTCEHPKCKAIIDRGLSYACGGFPGFDEHGCGLFFCGKHMFGYEDEYGDYHQACDVCCHNFTLPEGASRDDFMDYYEKKPDRPVWVRHKLKHSSWKEWRDTHADEVRSLTEFLANHKASKKASSKVDEEEAKS